MNRVDLFLSEVFEDEPGPLADDRPFVDVAGWDSLKHAELVAGIEQRFHVDLTRDDIAQLTSRGAVCRLLEGRGHVL